MVCQFLVNGLDVVNEMNVNAVGWSVVMNDLG